MTAALLWAAFSWPAAAQAPCERREAVLAELASRYGERPAAMGIAADGLVLEVLQSPGGETWTMIVTDADGLSCLVAAGEAWQDVIPENKGGFGT